MTNEANNRPVTILSWPKAILHADADSFFTSCEQALNPALKGKPNTDAVIKIKDDRKDDPQGEYGEFGQTSYFTFDKKGKGCRL